MIKKPVIAIVLLGNVDFKAKALLEIKRIIT